MIELVYADCGGCGHYRVKWPADYLIANGCPVVPSRLVMVFQGLTGISVQRPLESSVYDTLKRLKGITRVVDFDDMLFKLYGEDLPEYNHATAEMDLKETTSVIKKGFKNIDKLTVSTEFLKKAISDNYNSYFSDSFEGIDVVPNTLPSWLWNFGRRADIEEDIKKPRVLFAGSSTHYPLSGSDLGDFSPELVKWLHEDIDKIDLVFVGNIPLFLQDIADKITVVPFSNVLNYPRLLWNLAADFIIAPLKENIFNKCKSNLKYLEASAVGSVLVGSVFEDSPYQNLSSLTQMKPNMTVDDIRGIFLQACKKETYNELLKHQYDDLDKSWLEANIAKFVKPFKVEVKNG